LAKVRTALLQKHSVSLESAVDLPNSIYFPGSRFIVQAEIVHVVTHEPNDIRRLLTFNEAKTPFKQAIYQSIDMSLF
jgi:hypothetical protein